MRALQLYAGPAARRHVEQHGLQAADVGVVPAAAGGPKGLILGPLDRFIFGDWLARSTQAVDLVGASIGAWRMATACMEQPVAGFEMLEEGYIHGDMKAPPGRKLPPPSQVSATFAANLRTMFEGRIPAILAHPRYRLHVVTSRGRHVLAREGRWRTAAGYLGAALTNAASRRAMGAWLERVVFSVPGTPVAPGAGHGQPSPLPFDTRDYRTRHALLSQDNFYDVLQASGSIPFMLKAVHDISGAPRGAYWDGGITDYHLHLAYKGGASLSSGGNGVDDANGGSRAGALVLYPHFQKEVVPGWLDKPWKRRHGASSALDNMLLLAPNPEWIASLPNAKLPDRKDFQTLTHPERVKAWSVSVSAARQMADEFARWLEKPDPDGLKAL
ncbi:MAG: phospholipase [Ottowia sp.]|uniref:phospholipase n=1 Tax=Ottowia sp. TaxID=1898956 RepID=UPI003C7584A2